MTSLTILTTTLLLAHQIDSAYWHEWELFGIPGGIQVFVLLNVVLILPFLAGLALVAKGARAGAGFAAVLSILGVTTFCIHVGFALRGHREFGLPTSWAILVGTLLSSLALGGRVWAGRRKNRPRK